MPELSSCPSRTVQAVSKPSTLPPGQDKVLRIRAVMDLTGLSRSSVYRLALEGRFPRSIPLGPRSVGWLSSEVTAWIQGQAGSREVKA